MASLRAHSSAHSNMLLLMDLAQSALLALVLFGINNLLA